MRSSKPSRSTSRYLKRFRSSGRTQASQPGHPHLSRAFAKTLSHSHNNSSAPKTVMAARSLARAH